MQCLENRQFSGKQTGTGNTRQAKSESELKYVYVILVSKQTETSTFIPSMAPAILSADLLIS